MKLGHLDGILDQEAQLATAEMESAAVERDQAKAELGFASVAAASAVDHGPPPAYEEEEQPQVSREQQERHAQLVRKLEAELVAVKQGSKQAIEKQQAKHQEALVGKAQAEASVTAVTREMETLRQRHASELAAARQAAASSAQPVPSPDGDDDMDEEVIRRLLQENVRWDQRLESEPEPDAEELAALRAEVESARAELESAQELTAAAEELAEEAQQAAQQATARAESAEAEQDAMATAHAEALRAEGRVHAAALRQQQTRLHELERTLGAGGGADAAAIEARYGASLEEARVAMERMEAEAEAALAETKAELQAAQAAIAKVQQPVGPAAEQARARQAAEEQLRESERLRRLAEEGAQLATAEIESLRAELASTSLAAGTLGSLSPISAGTPAASHTPRTPPITAKEAATSVAAGSEDSLEISCRVGRVAVIHSPDGRRSHGQFELSTAAAAAAGGSALSDAVPTVAHRIWSEFGALARLLETRHPAACSALPRLPADCPVPRLVSGPSSCLHAPLRFAWL